MSEKMTDEALKEAVHDLYLGKDHSGARQRVLDGIAALTAERDEAKDDARGANETCEHLRSKWTAAEAERDALRERVKALEADRDGWRETWRNGTGRLLRRLAAIRQRAQDVDAMLKPLGASVSRYILGDDAPAPSDVDGLRGEMAETTTTSEAFARVRECLSMHEADDIQRDGLHAIALLERRMGALDRAMASILKHSDEPSTREVARAALTDATPVFTLEEVKQEVSPYLGPLSTRAVLKALTALRR